VAGIRPDDVDGNGWYREVLRDMSMLRALSERGTPIKLTGYNKQSVDFGDLNGGMDCCESVDLSYKQACTNQLGCWTHRSDALSPLWLADLTSLGLGRLDEGALAP
jgi:hypothetical protein